MLYEQVKRRLAANGTKVLQLTTSFRSQPRIQDAVNGAFERRMTGSEDGSQAEYVALEPFREDLADQPAVIALPVPRPYGRYGIYKRAIEDSLPDVVGAFVHWLVEESGWKVTELSGPGVLAVEISVLDLDVHPRRSGPEAGETFVASSEPYTLVMELRDSESWQPLARILEKRVLPAGSYTGEDIDYSRLKSVFDGFAVDIGRSLSSYHAIVQEIQRREEASEAH